LFEAGEYKCRYDYAADILECLQSYLHKGVPDHRDCNSYIRNMRKSLDGLEALHNAIDGAGQTKYQAEKSISEMVAGVEKIQADLNQEIAEMREVVDKHRPLIKRMRELASLFDKISSNTGKLNRLRNKMVRKMDLIIDKIGG